MTHSRQPTIADIEPTAAEAQSIRDAISKRIDIRKGSGLPELDSETIFAQQFAKLSDDKYEKVLKPYLRDAYELFPGSPGAAGRLKQHVDVYRHAEQALFDETGLRRPVVKPFNMVRFLTKYFGGQLPAS